MDGERTFDEHVGKNIRELRESIGLSQAGLAAEIMERIAEGAPSTTVFRQQTIDKIERGLRPIKLHEGLVIASALDCDMEVLCETEEATFDRALVVRGHISNYLKAEVELAEALDRLLDVRMHLQWGRDLDHSKLPPEVQKQLEYLANFDLIAWFKSQIANHRIELRNMDTEGLRDGHPSRYDTRV